MKSSTNVGFYLYVQYCTVELRVVRVDFVELASGVLTALCAFSWVVYFDIWHNLLDCKQNTSPTHPFHPFPPTNDGGCALTFNLSLICSCLIKFQCDRLQAALSLSLIAFLSAVATVVAVVIVAVAVTVVAVVVPH